MYQHLPVSIARCKACGKIGTYKIPTMTTDAFIHEMSNRDKVTILRDACEAGLDDIEHYGWWHKTQEKMRTALETTK